MQRSALAIVVAGLSVSAAGVASPAAADWLVTRDGARIETAGAWKVKGNQVVFTLPNGTLSSLRASEVDLDASALATAEALAAAEAEPGAQEAEPPPPREPVLVITDKDVRSASPLPEADEAASDAAAEDGGEGEEAGADAGVDAAAATSASPVEVLGWDTRDGADGLEIFGTVRNMGTTIASSIEVIVHVVEEDGQPLFETSAFLQSRNLSPGKASTFRALLPGITALPADPRIEVTSGEITLAPAAPIPAEDEAG